MKCGYCKNEMLKGAIPTPTIEWYPENGKIKLLYGDDKKQGFRLGKHHFLDWKEQEAWYCPVCDKLVIDCNTPTDQNSKNN